MEKGYLFILVGTLFATNLHIPMMPLEFFIWWERLTFWGFILISLGMRQVGGTEKELKYAQFFTMLSLLIRFGLPWISELALPFESIVLLALRLVFVFSPLAIFFWLFKSEYLWSPSSAKRMDWYIYTAVALVYLILNVMIMLPVITLTAHAITLLNMRQFADILYNIVLIGLLVKLYLAARNDVGRNRW